MKIEKINSNKIKVMIDDDEAKAWNVSIKSISQNTPQVQDMFWKAIRKAERDMEFFVDGAKLFVETEPHGDEGFGLFITRIESELELEKAIEQCSYKGHIKRREIRSKVTSDDLKTYDASKSRTKKATSALRRTADKQFTHIFKFEEFDAVCSAAKTVGGKFKGDSRLYKLEENYYIVLSAEEKRKSSKICSRLSEFGENCSATPLMFGRLNEYGKLMIPESAINKIALYM